MRPFLSTAVYNPHHLGSLFASYIPSLRFHYSSLTGLTLSRFYASTHPRPTSDCPSHSEHQIGYSLLRPAMDPAMPPIQRVAPHLSPHHVWISPHKAEEGKIGVAVSPLDHRWTHTLRAGGDMYKSIPGAAHRVFLLTEIHAHRIRRDLRIMGVVRFWEVFPNTLATAFNHVILQR